MYIKNYFKVKIIILKLRDLRKYELSSINIFTFLIGINQVIYIRINNIFCD